MTETRAAAVVALGVLAAYVAFLCPSAYWLDSSEFAAGAYLLGVPHPPGHPIVTLLGKALTLLPLGSVALRVGLSQALCGAAAAGLLMVIGARLSARTRAAFGEGEAPVSAPRPDGADLLLGAALALTTSLGYAAAFQAVRPEVYALQRLLSLGGVYHGLKYAAGPAPRDPRQLGLAALWWGLGLVNHHFLTLLVVPPALVFVWPDPEQRGALRAHLVRTIGPGLLAAGLALLFYVYLPLRAAHHTEVNWGSPTTLSRMFWVISAKAFQKSVKPPQSGDEELIGAVLEALHPIGALLGVLGLYLLIRQRPLRRVGLFLLLGTALVLGGRAMMGFDPLNPDAYGYLLPGIDLLAIAACAGAGGLLSLVRARPRARWLVALALVAGGVGAGAGSFGRVDRSRFYDLDTLLSSALSDAPGRALLLSSFFQTQFGLWYLQGVEGQRPDVTHVHPHFLPNPGYREDALVRHPGEGLESILGEREARLEPLLGGAREVMVEYDLTTPSEWARHLYPRGLLEQLAAPTTPVESGASADAQRRRSEVQARLDLSEPETQRNVFWRSFLLATLSCLQGDRVGYAGEMARLRQLLGNSALPPEIRQLEGRCPR